MRDNSPCIEHIEGNHFRCKNRGLDIYTDVLPIFCCGKPGKRNANTAAQLQSAALAEADIHYIHRMTDDITSLITTCLGCDKYDNRCNDGRFSSGCTGRRQWLKSLSSVGFRECPKWGT